jgi:hypothetical protein
MAKEQHKPYSPTPYTIKRIKCIHFSLNERLFEGGPENMVRMRLAPLLGFSPEFKIVNITLRVFYHYTDKPPEQVLFDIQVETLFEVPELQRHMQPSGVVTLPASLITEFIQLSLSHTRALLAQQLAATNYQEIILPVHDPETIARRFFAYMFDEERKVRLTDEDGKVETKTAKAPKTAGKKPSIRMGKSHSKNSY